MTPIEYPCTLDTIGYVRQAREEFGWVQIQIAMGFQVNPGIVSDIIRASLSPEQAPIPIPADILAQILVRVRSGYPATPETIGYIKAAHAEHPTWSRFKLALAYLVNPSNVTRALNGTRYIGCPPRPHPPEMSAIIAERIRPIRYRGDDGSR